MSNNRTELEFVRTSILSGERRTMTMAVDRDDLDRWLSHQALIQDALPYLSADQREFLMTGITPAEWQAHFGEMDDIMDDDLVGHELSEDEGRFL